MLLDYYEASMGNGTLASYDEDKEEVKNVTFWFQLYLGSIKMIMDIDSKNNDIIHSKPRLFLALI